VTFFDDVLTITSLNDVTNDFLS